VRSRLLTYLCEKYFREETGDISEYAIAVEALGRKSDFDPLSDSIVRVEAWRLRQRLKEFYATEGSGHAIQIVLPEGTYIPQFLLRKDPAPKGFAARFAPDLFGGNASIAPAADGATNSAVLSYQSAGIRFPWRRPAWHGRHAWATFIAIGVSALALLLFSVPQVRTRPPTKKGAPAAAGQPAASAKGMALVPPNGDLRILCGYQGEKFVDSQGRAWLGDRWFTGGSAAARPLRRIRGTRDEFLYRTVRTGDFRYDIPLLPGYYELRLHFSEILDEDLLPDSDGEDRRRFNFLVNGAMKLYRFDIVTDAGGPNIATERVFKDITPAADGMLRLEFKSVKAEALLNGIEVLPATKGRMRPVRILCGSGPYWQGAEATWLGDSYFRGGIGIRHIVNIETADDPNLYVGERYGNFAYAIPVADGTYRLKLRFAEFVFGSGDVGRRVFDVNCNGVVLLKDFDILHDAGGARRAVSRTFRGLKPNAQGKLLISFVPSKNYASVSAIEVSDESR